VKLDVTEGDLQRLSAFNRNQVENAVITDVIYKVARHYFLDHIKGCKLKSLESVSEMIFRSAYFLFSVVEKFNLFDSMLHRLFYVDWVCKENLKKI